MIEFTILVAISGVVTMRALWKLVSDRFPNPLDLAIVSTFYYAVPLAMCGYLGFNPRRMIFLHPAAADAGIALQALRIATLALLCLEAGRYLALRAGAPKLRYYFQLDVSSEARAQIGYAATFAMLFGGIALFGRDAFLAGYAVESMSATGDLGNALMAFSVGSAGLLITYSLLNARALNKPPQWALIGAVVVVALAVLIIRAKRLEIVTVFLPAAVILLSQRSKLKVTRGRLIWGGVAVAALIGIAFLRIDSDETDFFMGIFFFFSEGVYAGHSFPGVIGKVEGGVLAYEHGVRFLNALLGFVPRFVWPSKDEMVYAADLALRPLSPLGATSFLAESFLQGGIVAILLIYTPLGFFMQRLTCFEQVWDAGLASGKLPARFGAYLIAFAIFVPHFRDGLIPSIKLAIQAFVFWFALVGIRRMPFPVRIPLRG